MRPGDSWHRHAWIVPCLDGGMNAPVTTHRNTASCSRTVALTASGKAPSEILLFPAGHIDARDGRWWINDQPDVVIAAFDADGMKLPIDYEHALELAAPMGQAIPAAGWVTGLTNRDGAVWANVEWTPRAAEMIESTEYRYQSPVFWADVDHSILELVSIALTNQPALRHTALASKRGAIPATPNNEETPMDKAARIALCKSLGLTDEASDSAIQAAVEVLKTDKDKALASVATPPSDKFVPRADYDKVSGDLTKAQASLQEQSEKEVTDLVDAAVKAGKVDPASKAYHLAACKTEGGLDRFKEMVGDLDVSSVAKPSGLDDKTPRAATGTMTAEEKSMCKLTGTSHEDYLKERDGKKAA